MNQLNQCIVEGVFAKDARMTTDCNRNLVIRFDIETKRYDKDANGETVEEVSTFPVEWYGEHPVEWYGEHKFSNFLKGNTVRLIGRLKLKKCDGEDGKKHSAIIIIAEHFEVLGV